MTLLDALEQRIERIPFSTCWWWVGSLNSTGYGRYGQRRAHRLVYETLRMPVPEGLTLDHLCRNRACVNPGHLEAVPQRENTLRGIGPSAVNASKTHCIRGHMLDKTAASGWRYCGTCKYDVDKRTRRRRLEGT